MISKWTELCSHGLWYQQNHLIELRFFNWSLHISNLWLLYSPASSSYKGKLWWQGMLSWHFLAGANQYKSWIAFVDISQGEQHGRYHCQSLIAMKGQLRRDKHTWVYNVQPFELGRDEGYFQIKHACIPTPYIFFSSCPAHIHLYWASIGAAKSYCLFAFHWGARTCLPYCLVRTEQSALVQSTGSHHTQDPIVLGAAQRQRGTVSTWRM